MHADGEDDIDFDTIERLLEGSNLDQKLGKRPSRGSEASDQGRESRRRRRRQSDDDRHHHRSRSVDRPSRSSGRHEKRKRKGDSDVSRKRRSSSDRKRRRSRSTSSRPPRRRSTSSRPPRRQSSSPHKSPRIGTTINAAEIYRQEEKRIAEQEKLYLDEQQKRQKEIEDARRDDMTVLVLNLSLKASERDVWKFFSDNAGKVRDIQVIRDSRSGKSKGVGYVEFYTQESLIRSLNLSGQCILNQPIRVQASQAEKNRAARAAKVQAAEVLSLDAPMKVYVGGLVDALASIKENELKELFEPFGEIIDIDIHRNAYSGKNRGYAFISFRHAADARDAMAAMNGFEVAGRQIKVGYATEPGSNPADSSLTQAQIQLLQQQGLLRSGDDLLDDDEGLIRGGAATRMVLMQRLQEKLKPVTGSGSSENARQADGDGIGMHTQTVLPEVTSGGGIHVSRRLRLGNLFVAEDLAAEGGSFLDEVLEDVGAECQKYGAVKKSWLDREVLDGTVWVEFADPDGSTNARSALNGRSFGGNTISVEFVSDPIWNTNVLV